MVDFWCRFFTFTQCFSRLIRDINGEKNISLLMIFFTVSFSRFAPSRELSGWHSCKKRQQISEAWRGKKVSAPSPGHSFATEPQLLGTPPPRISQWKNFVSSLVENVEDFSWDFLQPLFLEITGRKSAKMFRHFFSLRFSPASAKKFAWFRSQEIPS